MRASGRHSAETTRGEQRRRVLAPSLLEHDEDEDQENDENNEFKILRPDCLAKDRLLLWRPSRGARGATSSLSGDDCSRITRVAVEAFDASTRATYGAGCKLFMEVCDVKNIPDRDRAPASKELIAAFLAQLVGAYSASTAKNYYAGIRAWHIIHGFPWPEDRLRLDVLLKAAAKRAPATSAQSQKKPYTVEDLQKIQSQLDRTVPLDAAVAAAANILFFGLDRLGEVTVRNQKSFSVTVHVTVSGLSEGRDREGRPVWSLFIPWTKVAPTGEKIQWARQNGLTDPVSALAEHRQLN